MENTGKTHGAHRENTGNIQDNIFMPKLAFHNFKQLLKHMENTGKTQGTYRENTGITIYINMTLGMKVPLKFLFRLIAP